MMKFTINNSVRQSLVLLLLALPAAVLSGIWHPRAPTFREEPLAPGEVHLRTALGWENVAWLDARSRAEYEEDHIPGARLLNEDEWEGLFPDFMAEWDPDQTIVVYCGGSRCQASTQVAERLRQDLGGEDIYVLKGGWSAWEQQR